MSGIVGIFGTDRAADKPALTAEMARLIKHVETDITDVWHDLNFSMARVHHGIVNNQKQPILNQNNSLLIFMDGEIYDYQPLKDNLLRKDYTFFYDHSDAEFCLHLYEEFGEKAFAKLNGSFILALYDLVNCRLIIVNDRFASRPLYYFSSPELLLFGSEVKAVMTYDRIPRVLDRRAVLEFFIFRKLLQTKTYYLGVQALPPATALYFENGTLTLNKYWEMNFREQIRPDKYYVDALTATFSQAVRRRMSDDHQYGILLSGGLDSRAVLAAAPPHRSIIAFTFGDWENREVKVARRIAQDKGVTPVFLPRWRHYATELASTLNEITEGMYEFWGGSPIGLINAIKHQGTEILLHGYLIDRLLKGLYLPWRQLHGLGYTLYLPYLAPFSNGEETLSSLSMYLLDYTNKENMLRHIFNSEFCDDWRDCVTETITDILREANKHCDNVYNKLDYFASHFISRIPTYYFELEIRNYMDVRTISLDNDLYDCYLEMPPHFRFRGRIFRKVLKNLSPKLALIPNANTGLAVDASPWLELVVTNWHMLRRTMGISPRLPDPTFTQGSWPNYPELFRYDKRLQQLLWDIIAADESTDPLIFNKPFLKEMFTKHMARKEDFSSYFLLILAFGMWYKDARLQSISG